MTSSHSFHSLEAEKGPISPKQHSQMGPSQAQPGPNRGPTLPNWGPTGAHLECCLGLHLGTHTSGHNCYQVVPPPPRGIPVPTL